jgi:hypothetical protein
VFHEARRIEPEDAFPLKASAEILIELRRPDL